MSSSLRPLCFVLMPFGRKPSGAGQTIDFDEVYNDIIKPSIISAGLEPIRADEEAAGGIIHKPMFERLVLCDYAIADLTTANANVFYELGVRHAAKPRSTILLFAEGHGRLPFDVAQLRAYPYSVSESGAPDEAEKDRSAITTKLVDAVKGEIPDSPLWQLLDEYPNIDHTKTDAFRDRVEIELRIKEQLRLARDSGEEAVDQVSQELGDLRDQPAGVLVDLMLSYRATSSWERMLSVVDQMDQSLASTVLVREQLGFALNRCGRSKDAEAVLTSLIEERGPSTETNGILGRVYKDQWKASLGQGNKYKTVGYINRAISTYIEGFEDDWRDAYPGINALTLLFLRDKDSEEFSELLPVVRYAVKRKISSGDVDYWDHATCFELAVLSGEEGEAKTALSEMFATVKEKWQLASTLSNLQLLTSQSDMPSWVSELEADLLAEAK